jgi:hypothetical protein
MSNAYLSPILQQSQFDDNGNFLAGGLIWSYVAGTTTPLAVYTTSDASVAWPNPIVLDARGECGGEIWLTAGSSYKFVVESAPAYGQTHGPTIATFDEVTGVNDSNTVVTTPNWIQFSGTPTYISGTSFSVSGDQRSVFQVYRRTKTINNTGTIYSSVLSSSYALGITTVSVLNDSGNLDAGLSAVYYGLIETDPSSIPPSFTSGTKMFFAQPSAPFGWTQVTTYNDYALRLVSGTGAGNGGSTGFSTIFNTTFAADATTLSTAQIPSHTHSGVIGFSSPNPAKGGGYDWDIPQTSTSTAATGGGGSHTHNLSFNLKYLDVILCEKD